MIHIKKVGATINSILEQYIEKVEYLSTGITKNYFLQGAIEAILYTSTPLTLLLLTILFR